MPRSVSILPGVNNVELPNGIAYSATYATTTAGPTVILTDEEFAKVGALGSAIQDNGNVGTSVVTQQGAAVALVTATTAVDLTTTEALANALKTTVNTLINNLSVAGGALA
jgi:hypothetical protein